ncbi:MAG: dihydrofolate reductase [Desulfobacterales bacterium]|jgi:dihydrofolate reductase
MLVSLIAAMAKNRVIGRQGNIPWKVPGEQKIFKQITLGHAVIMGRKTFESLKGPLAQRTNIIVTRQQDYVAEGCIVVHDLSQALKRCPPGENEAFIIGGGQLYQAAFTMTDRIYLTVIPRNIDGDTYFPKILSTDFRVIESRTITAPGSEPCDFYIYERLKK